MRRLLFALVFAGPAWAVPLTMTHQGRLLDVQGEPLSGAVTMTIALETPTESAWSDTFENVPVNNGYYAVVLGSLTPLQAAALTADEIEVVVTLPDDTELSRTPLTSVPYALHAAAVSGTVQVGTAGTCLGAQDAGTLRWNGTEVEACSGTANDWKRLGSGGSDIAFFARGITSTAQTQLPAVFGTELFDSGDGYNPSTGVFTAPVAGIYQFTYHVQFGNGSNSGHYVLAGLYTNGGPGSSSWTDANGVAPTYSEFRNDNNNSYRPITASRMVALQAGQSARVHTGAHSTVNAPIYTPSTYFSGFLVKAD